MTVDSTCSRQGPAQAATQHHCRWCGQGLAADCTRQLYCCATHAKKQSAHRRRLAARPLAPCPRPDKRAYPHRGTAVRHAVSDSLFPYLCCCGTYHLTKQFKNDYVAALTQVAADMGRTHAAVNAVHSATAA